MQARSSSLKLRVSIWKENAEIWLIRSLANRVSNFCSVQLISRATSNKFEAKKPGSADLSSLKTPDGRTFPSSRMIAAAAPASNTDHLLEVCSKQSSPQKYQRLLILNKASWYEFHILISFICIVTYNLLALSFLPATPVRFAFLADGLPQVAILAAQTCS